MEEAKGKESESQQLKYDRFRWAVEAVALVGGIAAVAANVSTVASWQAQVRLVLGAALLYLAVTSLIVEIILGHRLKSDSESPFTSAPGSYIADQTGLPPEDVLAMEFEYARITASEAMNDRHTVVNFYLLLTGVVVSAVVALINADRPAGFLTDALPYVGMALLWALCIVGGLYLLQIIRLRQAWRGSAKTMNQIKAFYIANAAHFEPQQFSQAFRWRMETLPPAEKLWTIHFFSAALIALLNSLVYIGGGLLFAVGLELSAEGWSWVVLGLACLGAVLFAFSLYMYVLFLKQNA